LVIQLDEKCIARLVDKYPTQPSTELHRIYKSITGEGCSYKTFGRRVKKFKPIKRSYDTGRISDKYEKFYSLPGIGDRLIKEIKDNGFTELNDLRKLNTPGKISEFLDEFSFQNEKVMYEDKINLLTAINSIKAKVKTWTGLDLTKQSNWCIVETGLNLLGKDLLEWFCEE
jgi:hypothetical protein